MADIVKPTLGKLRWDTAVDAAIDKVNAHDANPLVTATATTTGAVVGSVPAVTQMSGGVPTAHGYRNVGQLPRAQGMVCFTYDDANASMATVANLAAARGQRNTFFITSDQLGAGGKITTSQLQAMFGQGHEIGGHSKTHADVAAIGTAAGRAVEYDTPKTAVEAIIGAGTVKSWAYPFGSRSATTDTELYLRYDRIFGTGYTTPAVIPLAGRDDRFLVGRVGWSAANHDTILDLIRLAATSPVVVVIYTHDPGNGSGAFPTDPSVAQVTAAYDLAASLGVPSVRVDEALPALCRLINPGFENGLSGWSLPTGAGNLTVETVTDTPMTGLTGTKSLHMAAVAAASQTVWLEQAVAVEPNTAYSMTCRFRATVTTGDVRFNIKQYSYGGVSISDTTTTISATEAWTARGRDFTTAATCTTVLVQFGIPLNGVGELWADHVHIAPTHLGKFG